MKTPDRRRAPVSRPPRAVCASRIWGAIASCAPLIVLALILSGPVPAAARPVPPVSLHRAASPASVPRGVTGQYEAGAYATLDVLKLPGSRIKFDILILFDLSATDGPRTREVTGVAPLRHGRAVYRSGGGSLVMDFKGHKVIVLQQGKMEGDLEDLDGIRAGGTYVKRNSRVPVFDPDRS